MARGKHGTAAETKRAAADAETIQELRTQLADLRRTAHHEAQELRAELARAHAEMRAEAERLAEAGIRAAQEETAAAVAAGQRRHDERVEAVAAVLRKRRPDEDDMIDTSFDTWIEIAGALGIEPGRLWVQLADGSDHPRWKRRTGRGALSRATDYLDEDGKANPRTGPPGGMVVRKRP